MAEHKRSRLLEGVRNDFLIQVLRGPPRDDAQVDVLFPTKDKLIIQKHCLGHVGLLLGKPKLICSLDL